MFKSLRSTAYQFRRTRRTQHLREKSSSSNLINVAVNNVGVAVITMQRHPVNALSLDLLSELRGTLESAEPDKLRGILLTSGCKGVFSAGLDIKEMYNPQVDRFREYWICLKEVLLKLNVTGIPTVAVVNGLAIAGGCLLSLCCDYRIMLTGYTIGMNETQLGIAVPDWVHTIMTSVISQRRAELVLTSGVILMSEEGQSIGWIDEVANDESDAWDKAGLFFKQVETVGRRQNSASKASALKDALKHNDKDMKSFLLSIKDPAVQQTLKKFIK